VPSECVHEWEPVGGYAIEEDDPLTFDKWRCSVCDAYVEAEDPNGDT
jgi:hypothetical protein